MNDDLQYIYDNYSSPSDVTQKPDKAKDPDIANISELIKEVKRLDELIAHFNTFDIIDERKKLSYEQQVEVYKEVVSVLRNIKAPLEAKIEELKDE